MNEKNKIEALLFASAKRMTVEEISKITGIRNPDKIKAALCELKTDFESRGASVVLVEDGAYWKLTIKDHYMPMLQKILTQAELDRPLMETLAVIAWKYPVLQADVVKIRHNKAYEHLKQLDELGFISRIRFGRTNKITLTQKFFEYFDLPTKEQAKEVFKNIVPEKIKEKVEQAEVEIDEAEKKIEERKRKEEEMKKAKKEEEKKLGNPQKPVPKIEPNPIKHVPKVEDMHKKDEELKEIEKDVEDIMKEEDKDVNSKMSEVQEQDEVSEPDK